MSTESQNGLVRTATGVIFSPEMNGALVVVNKKLNRILPPGRKFDAYQDMDIVDTLLREIREEIRLALFPATWVFLNRMGIPIVDPEPVQREEFIFIDDGKTRGQDFLFFFRLHTMVWFRLKGEVQGHFFTKEQIEQERAELESGMYEVLFPSLREAILKVMR